MSIYNFAPMPPTQREHESFVVWENGFTSEELDRIEAYCDALPQRKATIGGRDKDDDYTDYRKSKVSWISLDSDTSWFYDKMAWIARKLNSMFYRFDLSGFVEDMQFTIYDGEGDHYDWHTDAGSRHDTPRKFSLVLQLTDPNQYDGGELQLQVSKDPTPVRRERGLVAAFPSYTLHRVTPVTRGIRKTIVVWVSGPPFR
jgi:PKHD-type hydroxylase